MELFFDYKIKGSLKRFVNVMYSISEAVTKKQIRHVIKISEAATERSYQK